jgi:hypothetical protein
MNRLLIVLALVLSPAIAWAEKATYDLVRYTPPAPWKKTAWKKDAVKDKWSVNYTMTDQVTRTWCRIVILKSTTSKGDITADFESEWKTVIAEPYKSTDAPQVTDALAEDGWQVKAGVGTFPFNGQTSIAMITTISGYGRAVSIYMVTNSADYAPALEQLLGSVEMKKPAVAKQASTPTAKQPAAQTAKPQALQGYMEYSPYTKTWTWRLRTPPK